MATLIDQEFFARLRVLNEKFAAGVPGTIERLRTIRAGFDPQAPDRAAVDDMHQLLHTIAGSAATFGFRVLGQQARAIEQRLRVLMAFEVIAANDWNNWLGILDDYLAWAERDPKADRYDPASPE